MLCFEQLVVNRKLSWKFFKAYHGLSENSYAEYKDNVQDDLILEHGQTGNRGKYDILRDRETGKRNYSGKAKEGAGALRSERTRESWEEFFRQESA